MYKIIIFGTGKSCEDILESINYKKVEIVCFIDNNKNKVNSFFNETNIRINRVDEIKKFEYDYIIIASIYPELMREQLINNMVDSHKIISYFSLSKKEVYNYSNLFLSKKVILNLIENKYEREIERLERYIDNIPYEIYDNLKKYAIKQPKVKSLRSTMETLLSKKYSLSRIGDGEFMILLGKSINFQQYDHVLAERLKDVLNCDNPNCLIAIADEFGDLDCFKNRKSKDDIRKFLTKNVRNSLYEMLDFDKEYYNAFVTRPYMFLDVSDVSYYFESFKKMWNEKDILIIEGERTYFGINNDLLDNAASCKRIICPSVNAFSKYEEILSITKKYLSDVIGNNSIVLAALGPTATILAYDLAMEGFQVIDIGHLDLEYEWYSKNAKEPILINYKYCDAVEGGHNPKELLSNEFDIQVISKIV